LTLRSSSSGRPSSARLVAHAEGSLQRVENLPAGVASGPGTITRPGIQVGTAGGAQSPAVGCAQWGKRELDQQGLAGQRLEIDVLVVEGIALTVAGPGLEQLAELGGGLSVQRPQAAPTLPLPSGDDLAARKHPLVNPLEKRINHDLRAGRDRRAYDSHLAEQT